MIIASWRRRLALALAVAAAGGGTCVALYYHHADLTLSHYDARGHLIVARRIFDSLTPGWRQIGAVWLPLPHLLNALPVQIDAFYRTGASGVAFSVVSFALATASIGWIVATVTGSAAAAIVSAGVFALNPNVLYLQATPMTELLLLGFLLLAIAMLMEWTRGGDAAVTTPPAPAAVGCIFALACLTRYEAWPVTAAALAIAVWMRQASGRSPAETVRGVTRIAIYPAVAIAGFMAFSKVVVGQWFVSTGFFIPDNPARGRPLAVVSSVVRATDALTGHGLIVAGAVGLMALLAVGFLDRRRAWMVVPLSLVAAASLPFLAFLQGHPFRIRYMVPLIAAQAVGVGVAAGLSQRVRLAAVCAIALMAAVELRPLDRTSPMVVEAQWDRANSIGRQRVTECLRRDYANETIMASMGSLGHYMQELSHAGFRLRDFLHEGNGETWQRAIDGARPFVGWVMISEGTDGRDPLLGPSRENPHFLEGFSRVCEGGLVALYRRVG